MLKACMSSPVLCTLPGSFPIHHVISRKNPSFFHFDNHDSALLRTNTLEYKLLSPIYSRKTQLHSRNVYVSCKLNGHHARETFYPVFSSNFLKKLSDNSKEGKTLDITPLKSMNCLRASLSCALASCYALVILLSTLDQAYAAGSAGRPLPLGGNGPFPCEDTGSYYAPANGLAGSELKTKLHQIVDNHYSLSYSAVWDTLKILDAADEADPMSSPDIFEIYAQRRSPKDLAAKPDGWNREHLWPRSFGLTEGNPEFTDVHNLRPSDVNVNSSRGNKVYSECSLSPTDSCLIPANKEAAFDTAATRNTWTPPENVRGDIARALFYMAVRYEGNDKGSIDLELSDSPNASEGKMGMLSVLLKWNQLDPPSPSERLRNSRVCSLVQHNRNPFVDDPHYADLIWGDQTSSGGLVRPTFPELQPKPKLFVDTPASLPPFPSSPFSSSSSSSSSSPPMSNPQCQDPAYVNAWINEFHYNNAGPDRAEFIEVVVGPGIEPTDLSIFFYNGYDQKVYKKIPLSAFSLGEFNNEGYKVFAILLPTNTIQNGPSDGFALVRSGKKGENGESIPPSMVQFLSYEGDLVAKDGPAKGKRSMDVGVEESNESLVSSSVGLFGKGGSYGDFKWKVFKEESSFARFNPGQLVEIGKGC